ncbi:integral membrane protein [Candidatus Thiomargarita nelsonii]|uniref:Integral membrane protein n=1 Tax=Candidatus Thiomargarita nelsonii TaxID=1003181 RepID=A0A176S4J1_9GAMM|nr:integral membrane protein [Candidatus Thiomargarita nelsonii]
MPLGMGYTVEGQVSGKEEFGGIQIIVFEPKPGRFPEEPPKIAAATRGFPTEESDVVCCEFEEEFGGSEMGLAAGGKMKQKIYPDKYGVETWDENHFGRVYVHIVNSMMYEQITGKKAPSTPVTAKTYTQYGFPWFDLYDEHKGDVEQSNILSQVKSVKEMDNKKGFAPQQDDSGVEISDEQVKKLKLKSDVVRDGKW